MSSARLKLILAGYTQSLAQGATVSFTPATVENGAAEGVLIGEVTVSATTLPFTAYLDSTQGGLIKIENNRVYTGATPTTNQTELVISGTVVFTGGPTVAWGGTATVQSPLPSGVEPSAAWSGAATGAGSGYTEANGYAGDAPPADPTRLTAKPSCRPFQPNRSYIRTGQRLGFNAGPHSQVASVVLHFAGNRYTVTEPTAYSYTCPRTGATKTMVGYWFPPMTPPTWSGFGTVTAYVEVIPVDPTMQVRVMTYTYYKGDPATHTITHDGEAFDAYVEFGPNLVATSSPTIAHRYTAKFTTWLAAMRWLSLQTTIKHPLVKSMSTHTALPGDFRNGGIQRHKDATTKIIAETGTVLTIGKTYAEGLAADTARVYYDGIWFAGEDDNIVLDMAHWVGIQHENRATTPNHLLTGVKITNSTGPDPLYKGAAVITKTTKIVETGELYDCLLEKLGMGAAARATVINCEITQCNEDLISRVQHAYGNYCHDCTQAAFRDGIEDALVITFDNAAASAASVVMPGTNSFGESDYNALNMTFSHTIAGVTTTTVFDMGDASTWYNDGLAAAINALGNGWSAVSQYNDRGNMDRRAAMLCVTVGGTSGFLSQDMKALGTLSLRTGESLHADWFQFEPGSYENYIVYGNTGLRLSIQGMLLSDPMFDVWIANNALYVTGETFSSMAYEPHKHVVLQHNTWTNQSFALRYNKTNPYRPDAYCLNENNYFDTVSEETVGGNALGTIRNNHLRSGSWTGATGGTSGGTLAGNIVDPANGDFAMKAGGTPHGNEKTPVIAFDMNAVARGATDWVGAVSKNG